MKVLVTGGAGYIGSHTVLQLIEAGKEVVVLDNLSNSSRVALARLEKLAGQTIAFIEGDIRDAQLLERLFADHDFDSVVHFAGWKAVGESVENPLEYYDNNVNGTLVLCSAMQKAGVKKIVFSSSATVYGDPKTLPITETSPVGGTTNPYGTSKYMVERVLEDITISNPEWCVSLLRYFNPVGAHDSGTIGEDPNGIPNNLVPFISQVAVGKLAKLSVFGDDYDTPDGTGVRDYIHVVDLAEGHLKALDYLEKHPGCHVHNLGTGVGSSVLEMVRAFERASGNTIPFEVKPRRSGDIATCFADPMKAERELGWKAKLTLSDMMLDTWRWQSNNPNGYNS
ncbi:UDP-glucose 4-epimerase GalE [Umboniibacter marinipuniceus]|uniref:UDP-glucose 4-epimerase n=1 Tax=Umboniibacter marinipuniceus TaxID=569599 RepID=A0A3M0A574_9GAMM|nr:UDP-glucose 4-epimerase GalE [Umboniibacter marinipuniceus]RMA79524.1 UDP-galactose 4-epimerase [Umboniibacter marinipuniceus]